MPDSKFSTPSYLWGTYCVQGLDGGRIPADIQELGEPSHSSPGRGRPWAVP